MRERMQVVAVAMVFAGSCGILEPDTEPTVLNLAFVTDSAEYYTGVFAASCGSYCQAWQPDSARFDGTVTMTRPDTAVIAVHIAFEGKYTISGGQLNAWGGNNVSGGGGCRTFALSGTMTGSTVEGTWIELSDCHGISRAGRFSTK
jgi:hypothetical protein